jgi:hypothetical protein
MLLATEQGDKYLFPYKNNPCSVVVDWHKKQYRKPAKG